MQTALLLSKPQAEAVYSAMCALNNVGGRVLAFIPLGGGHVATVRERAAGYVWIEAEGFGGINEELHDSQSAFAAAYGLSA